MREFHVLAVGRLRPACRALADEYLARIRRVMPVSEHEVREAGRAGAEAVQRRVEADRLRGALPANGVVVALTRGGTGWSSRELARQVGRWRESVRDVVLVIGGASGLDPGLLETADRRWSLGPLTLPHEFARVIVLEQLYRALTILRGGQYHRGGG
jgi:23S rRNA (pseudouridine1915-N3)-methyltransferase